MRILQCCSATLLLFNRRNMTIFPLYSSHRQRAGSQRKEAERKEAEKRKRTAMFANLVRLIRSWNRYNRSLNELSRLGDRELADIGISRSDIVRVAWNSAQQR
jgi:uncharacterized protein YjiS (DUF1127 family)